MEAFFPAYLQSTSRPDPRIEVSQSVKIINNRHCRQLRIPIPPTTKSSALCRFSSSNILMWSWIRYSFSEIQICIFCLLFFLYEPWLAWDRGRAYFWFYAWGGGDHLNLWIWARMTWWPYLSENYVTRRIRLCHLSTICFHFPEHNFGGLTRIQNKGLLTRWCFFWTIGKSI